MLVYRILTMTEWDSVKGQQAYRPKELRQDGFIHLSFKEQLTAVATSLYKEHHTLVVLQLDTTLFKEPDKLQIEDLYGLDMDFPHLYGELDFNAVTGVFEMKQEDDHFFLDF